VGLILAVEASTGSGDDQGQWMLVMDCGGTQIRRVFHGAEQK
jgi:hypothetical protein